MNTIEIPELTITKTVTEVQTIDLPDYPNFIKWASILVRGEDSEGKYGELSIVYSFDIFNIETEFIPFENLTEETILSWINSRSSTQALVRLETQVKSRYIESNFPKGSYMVSDLPWNLT